MKKFPTIIAVMIFVTIAANWMLDKDYATEIVSQDRFMISIGAGLLSGTIMWIFFALEKKKE
ncbi:hypothetical protein [Cytobacillus purgationiresistens]|uniref:Histidine kinase n=1 Tax=Cytobacillus purgationiresistens TaxID=863449 RepID=A0ABU0ANJ5_9BACI|nr:hypothetical protein [Cytobacillus purgationiresistens]MDQ0272862.1 hypothetical protein [Cytobacillus purgationiresistens]